MPEIHSCFVPAAGLGERLRPITNIIPKALLPVLGKPAISRVISRLLTLNPSRIAVNTHHLHHEMKQWARSEYPDTVVLFHEPAILGTGGGLKKASLVLAGGTFIVHNADILSDINLSELLDFHRHSGCIATLAVRNDPRMANLLVDRRGCLAGARSFSLPSADVSTRTAFTGIAVYEPDFLGFLPDGASDVVNAWCKAITQGHSIAVFDTTGIFWGDIGTPSSYAETTFRLLRAMGRSVHIGSSVTGCRTSVFQGSVVVEDGVHLPERISLHDVIVLPGGILEKNGFFQDCIVTATGCVPIRRDEGTGNNKKEPEPLGTGGSDRIFTREKHKTRELIRMRCMPGDPDFARHTALTGIFRSGGVPVPELISVNESQGEAWFEDLGDMSLFSWLQCPRRESEVGEMYRSVLRGLVRLHSLRGTAVENSVLRGLRQFDYGHLRWETEYFLERYVSGVRGIPVQDYTGLDEELHSLALQVCAFPKTFVHRDFQSQNIMIRNTGEPLFIDYQGARIGPSAYDVASLLWDPYYRLQERTRDSLVFFYMEEMGNHNGKEAPFDASLFRESLVPCRMQRHMQALGAFGFLANVRGKRYFLSYAGECLGLLRDDLAACSGKYPVLSRLVSRLAG